MIAKTASLLFLLSLFSTAYSQAPEETTWRTDSLRGRVATVLTVYEAPKNSPDNGFQQPHFLKKYNKRGQLTEIDFFRDVQEYCHDTRGRLTCVININGITTHYRYDAEGRLIESKSRGFRGEGESTTLFSYDSKGRPDTGHPIPGI